MTFRAVISESFTEISKKKQVPELYLKSIDLKVSEGRSVHFLKKVLLKS